MPTAGSRPDAALNPFRTACGTIFISCDAGSAPTHTAKNVGMANRPFMTTAPPKWQMKSFLLSPEFAAQSITGAQKDMSTLRTSE